MTFPPPGTHELHPPTVAPRPRLLSASNVVLFLLGLIYLLTYIDRVNVFTASNVFEKELHLDKTQVGLIFSALPTRILSSKSSTATSATGSARAGC